MPEPWLFILLAAVAFRLTRLVGWDDITIRARGWLGVSDADYSAMVDDLNGIEEKGGDPFDTSYFVQGASLPFGPRRWYLAKLIRCPWCAGFWVSMIVSLGAAGAGLLSWGWAVPIGLALSSLVGLTAKWLDP